MCIKTYALKWKDYWMLLSALCSIMHMVGICLVNLVATSLSQKVVSGVCTPVVCAWALTCQEAAYLWLVMLC